MSDLSKKYQEILNELSQKIGDKEELEFVKQKFAELSVEYMSSIGRILEIERNQTRIEKKLHKIQNELSMIEEDLYIDDSFDDYDFVGDKMHDNDCYEFEITCPYCNYEFVTDESYKDESEIECPKCHNIIELDWRDEYCDGNCGGCDSVCDENYKYEHTDNQSSKVMEEDIKNSKSNKKSKNKTSNDGNEDINYIDNNINDAISKDENNDDDM